MKKRIALAILLLLTLLFCSCKKDIDQPVNENLLTNPNFEQGTGVEIEGWKLDRYDVSSPIEAYQVVEDETAPSGKNVIKIESSDFNDARFIQNVEVMPDSYYCLSAWVKTELIEQREAESGASIGFLQTYCQSQYVKSNTDWTKVTLYGKTGKDTESVNVALRLGGYAADASGIAYFDDVSFTRIDELPKGATAYSMDTFEFSSSQDSNSDSEKQKKDDNDIIVNVSVTGVILFLVLGAFLFWAYKEFDFKMKHMFIFVGVALIIRFIASTLYAGFLVDIKCFTSWGNTMVSAGISDFYQKAGFCDYPPLYMMVLGIVSSLAKLFGINTSTLMTLQLANISAIEVLPEGTKAALFLLKSPAMICDALSAIMLALIAKKHVGEKVAALLGIGYALLPTAIVNSALWGQVDSVLVLFMLITFWLIDKDQFGLSVVTFFIGLLFKPQAILFGPVMLLVAIHEFYLIYLDFSDKDSKSATMRLIKGFGGLLISIGIFALLSMVMNPGKAYLAQNKIEGDWLIGMYLNTLGSYDYATLSSFGLMGLLDGQWVPSQAEVSDGVTYGALGTSLLWVVGILVVGIFVFLIARAIENNSKGRNTRIVPSGWFWLLGALMVAGAVTVSTRTHERYMFPVIMMTLMSYVHFKDFKLLIISFGYGLLNFINTAGLMFLYEEAGVYFANSDVASINESIFKIGSFLTVALFIFQVYVTISLMFKKETIEMQKRNAVKPVNKNTAYAQKIKPESNLTKLLKRRNYRLPKVTWKEILICFMITAVYACFAFKDLGDVKAAQNFWYADEKTEVYAVADLGEAKEFDSIKYLSTSANGMIKVYLSDDGENYTYHATAAVDSTDGWKDMAGASKARYVKFVTSSAVNISEAVILKDNIPLEINKTSQQVVPVNAISGAAENLFDDQESYFRGKIEPKGPETFWTTGGNYTFEFSDLTAVYGIRAYFKEAGQFIVAVPSEIISTETNEEWTDAILVKSDAEGWADGELLIPDESLERAASILIKNDGALIGEMEIKRYPEAQVTTIYKDDSVASDGDEIHNVFDERHTLNETPSYTTGKSWNITTLADYVIADFGEVKNVDRGYYRTSLTKGSFGVYFSEDGIEWTKQNTLSVQESNLYYWYNISASGKARYVLITAETQYLKLIEVGFFESKEAESTIPIKEIIAPNENAKNVFDEQELVPPEGATYMNSMYFDEIYHARTAYESANGHSIYEWTHPPLGKDMMSWCVSLMGMTPFAWRFAGTVAGVLMIPAMFFLGFLMFRKTSWATMTAMLMACDGMHYVQTRIATIDSFGVLFIILMFLFMYWYQSLSFYDVPLKKTFLPLGLCGLCFGLGAASKWICLYAGAGLAVIFFTVMIRRWREYSIAVDNVKKATGEEKKYLNHIINSCGMNSIYTILFCIGVFIVIPLVIYCLSYYPYWNAETETRKWYDIIISNQEAMFNYHSKLEATHPYQSDWYTWPTMKTPMFYYSGPQNAENMSAIYAFGNPIVWYSGLIATIAGIGVLVSRLFTEKTFVSCSDKKSNAFLSLFGAGDEDNLDASERDTRTLLFLLIGVACNLVPWMGINRCIFIYHYFATVPFIIFFTVYILRTISRINKPIGITVAIILTVVAAVTFVMFLPIWTGTSVSREYVGTWLRWQDGWFGYYFPKG